MQLCFKTALTDKPGTSSRLSISEKLHVILSYAISTYAFSTAVISTYYTFKRLQFQPPAISTYLN